MTASTSPHKLASRHPLPSPDPISVRLPESPDKNAARPLRRLQSHNQLSSRPSRGLLVKPSKEQLKPNTPAPTGSLPTRARANSDAPMPLDRPRVSRRPLTTIAHPSSSTTASSNHHSRKSSLELTLRDGPPPGTSPASALSLLRHSILTSGVTATKEGMSDYRIYLWLTLLNIPALRTDTYLSLIHRGRSPAYEKISNDVFRTLATDTLFKRRVTDASLTRLLNATAWRIHDDQTALPPGAPQTQIQAEYIQGINVLSAPLLYASRSEAQAYAILTVLLTQHIPTYLSPTMSGVHRGLELIDRILAFINPTLSSFLLSKSLPAKIYAFPSVLTLCACTPPLPEVLKLWDFLFAFGVHLNVVCVVAQLLLLKDTLLESQSPGKILRSFSHLNADEVIKMTLLIVRDLPEVLYAEVVVHGRM